MSISTSDGPFCDAAQNGPVTRDALICGYLRTPFGRYGGVLARLRPDLMAAHVLRAIVERHHLAPATVDDVILGCANQAGEDNRNVARMALLLAGFPVEVPGQTVNRLCGSSLQALNSAAQAIWSGQGDLFVAGGVESMTRAPVVMLKAESEFPRGTPRAAFRANGSCPRRQRLGHQRRSVRAPCRVGRARARARPRADRASREHRSRGRAPRRDGPRSDPRLAPGALAGGACGEGHGPRRDQRGIREPGRRLLRRARDRLAGRATAEPARRRDRARASARRERRAPRRDRGARARAPQGPLPARDDVHRSRPGDPDGAGARGLVAGRASLAADQIGLDGTRPPRSTFASRPDAAFARSTTWVVQPDRTLNEVQVTEVQADRPARSLLFPRQAPSALHLERTCAARRAGSSRARGHCGSPPPA